MLTKQHPDLYQVFSSHTPTRCLANSHTVENMVQTNTASMLVFEYDHQVDFFSTYFHMSVHTLAHPKGNPHTKPTQHQGYILRHSYQ